MKLEKIAIGLFVIACALGFSAIAFLPHEASGILFVPALFLAGLSLILFCINYMSKK